MIGKWILKFIDYIISEPRAVVYELLRFFRFQQTGTKALGYALAFCCLIAGGIITHAYAVPMKGSEKAEYVELTQSISVNSWVEEQDYHYASMTYSNPFVPPLLSTLMARLVIPIESPLQKHQLLNLKVVGIWTLRNLETRAMIATPDNEAAVVQVGSPIGRRGGTVAAIDATSITVREFSLMSNGTRQYEDLKIWIEDEEPKFQENNIILNSSKAGMPNSFGYGKKNYTNSPTYEEKRKELLKTLEEESKKEVKVDDTRPTLPPNTDMSVRDTSSTIAPEGDIQIPKSTGAAPQPSIAAPPSAVAPLVSPSPQSSAMPAMPSLPGGINK